MSVFALGVAISCLLLVFLFMEIQIWAALALIGILGFTFFLPYMKEIMGAICFNSITSAALTAIPLFLFMGEIMANNGLSKNLYRGLRKLTASLPGGLLHTNIICCSIFAAISGSSVATASTFGTIAYKEQKEFGYPPEIISGTLAAGGTLGILIPPSIPLLIYASMTGQSASKLFMAGIFPGIVMSLFFMVYIYIFSVIKRESFKNVEKIDPFRFRDFPELLKDIWPFFLIILSILVGIYGGIMTPTEAAAVSVVEALIFTFLIGKLTFNLLKKSAISALKTNAMIMLIYIGAQILGYFISMIKLPANLCTMIQNMEISKFAVLFIITLMYYVLGSLMEAMSAIIITIPVTYPLMVGSMGFDPIWFGIYLVILNQIGLITPPVGLNSYIIYGISGEKGMGTVFKGVMPFVVIMLLFIILILVYPNIVLFLPSRM